MRTRLQKMSLRLLLMAIAAVSYLPAWAQVGTEITQSGIKYTVTGSNEVEVSGTENSDITEVKIPAEISANGVKYGVTALGDNAFNSHLHLSSVELPASIESIGDYAFNGCKVLSSIEIPANVKFIGKSAFDTTDISSIDLKNVQTIGEGAFFMCDKLTSVKLSAGIKVIPVSAFNSCTSLNQLVLPDGLTTIMTNAFANCNALTELSLPSSINDLQARALCLMNGVTTITIPEGISVLSEGLLSGCGNLTTVNLPSTLTDIGYQALESCKKLVNIDIPEGVESIGETAFATCESLVKLVIPAKVKTLGGAAFAGCTSLKDLYVNTTMLTYDESLFHDVDISSCTLYIPFGTKDKFTSWVGFKDIKEQTASSYKVSWQVEDIKVKDQVETAKAGEPLVIEILDPKTGKPADQLWLYSVFSNKEQVKDCNYDRETYKLTIPNVSGDLDIQIKGFLLHSDSELSYKIVKKGLLAEEGLALVAGINGQAKEKYIIPENVIFDGLSHSIQEVYATAFTDNKTLRNITLPVSVKKIGGTAFMNCTALNEIHIKNPNVITITGINQAFEGVDKTKCVVYVPKGSLAAYKGWGGFTNILEEGATSYKITCVQVDIKADVPESVKPGESLAIKLFDPITNEPTEQLWAFSVYSDGKRVENCEVKECTLIVPEVKGNLDIKLQGYYTHSDSELTYWVVKKGWSAQNEFATVTGINGKSKESYTVPEKVLFDGINYKVQWIHYYAFRDNEVLRSITLPVSVETIDPYAFMNCTALSEIHIKNPKMIEARDKAFDGVDKTRCIVYVPKGSLATYKDWGGFKNIIEEGSKYSIKCTFSDIKASEEIPATIEGGKPLKLTLLVDKGIELPETILVNGEEKADWFTYDNKTGVIEIANVQWNIEIKARGVVSKVSVEENKELKDQAIKELEVPAAKEVELSLTDVESGAIKVGSGAKVTLMLSGTVDLGTVTNEGTIEIPEGSAKEAKYTSIENKGTFKDEAGIITKVEGLAALDMKAPLDKTSNVEEGGSATLAVGIQETTGVAYTWQKQITGGAWKQVKPVKESKASLLRADQVEEEKAYEYKVSAADAGVYRCLISREIDNGGTTISTTLTTYTEVKVKSSSPDITYYSVTLPTVEGATTTPVSGSYEIAEGETFSFTLTLDKAYDQSKPVVKVADQVIEPTAAGKYEIKNVGANVTVSITGIVKNPTVGMDEAEGGASVKAWGANGVLHISSAEPATAYVVSFGGRYKAIQVTGEIAITDMPKGAYIVRIKDKVFKIAL